jgi:hypothetical protein
MPYQVLTEKKENLLYNSEEQMSSTKSASIICGVRELKDKYVLEYE